MTIQTPNNVHAIASILQEFNGGVQSAQLLNSDNIESLNWVPNALSRIYLPMVQSIAPEEAIVSLFPQDAPADQLQAWITPTPEPTGDPDLDAIADGAIVANIEPPNFPNLIRWGIAVFHVQSESGPVVPITPVP